MRGAVLALVAALLAVASPLRAADAPEILQTRCVACHRHLDGGRLSRISDQRKTPEAWAMTIARMEHIHNLKVGDDERGTLVKYLSDTQGLAPEETRGFRYVLEQRTDVIEAPPDEELAVLCGRCHSYAKVALQRRPEAEWLKLAHFHVGQWPSLEYQSRGRDRNWWEIASTRAPARLAALYPLSTSAWSAWQAREKRDPSGSWRVVGRRPGAGAYEGRMSVSRSAADEYAITLDLRYADGTRAAGKGSAIVYTGYEWRGILDLGKEKISQVLALSEDGQELSGRWFVTDSDVLGADVRSVRDGGAPRILAVEPPFLRGGAQTEVAIHGVGLEGDVSFGDGVEIERREATSDTVRIFARAKQGAAVGARAVKVGKTEAQGLFAIYDRIGSVRVEPPYAIARVGGGGGTKPPVPVQFDAIAYLDGPDGKPGTTDDVRLGTMKARWSVTDFDATAEKLEDARFAGTMKPGGLFVPADAGPNPRRPFHTNNAGDLKVHATVADGPRSVQGTAHLVVTVQRWVDPPLR
ncbi:MAG: quinohemoprotein amine dehydrogenase subunit alpha [Candidatus Binatia bacterium]